MPHSLSSRLLAILPCLAIACTTSMAAEKATRTQAAITDVALQADGTLAGRVLDSEGRAIDGAIVVISRDQKVLGHTTSDQQGAYQFGVQDGGVYRLSAGRTVRDVRVWPAQVAPPGAKPQALIVDSADVIRAQNCDGTSGCGCGCGGRGCGIVGYGGIALGATGIIIGAIALDKANDAEDDVAELRAILNNLSP